LREAECSLEDWHRLSDAINRKNQILAGDCYRLQERNKQLVAENTTLRRRYRQMLGNVQHMVGQLNHMQKHANKCLQRDKDENGGQHDVAPKDT
jgi:hypothetical protein